MDLYGRMAKYYDAIGPYRDRKDLAFFVDMAVESGGPVLELGSGTGRVLIPTARAGVSITGLDTSDAMLAVCRESLARETQDVRGRVTLVPGDMTSFQLDQRFALITFPFRPFQHLHSVEDQVACLECAHRHLSDDGRLVLDLFNPMIERLTAEYPTELESEPAVTLEDGSELIRSWRARACDRANQVLEVEMIIQVTHPGRATERHVDPVKLRYFFRYEVEHLLARCGFTIQHLYSDYDRKPFGAIYPGELLYIARKT